MNGIYQYNAEAALIGYLPDGAQAYAHLTCLWLRLIVALRAMEVRHEVDPRRHLMEREALTMKEAAARRLAHKPRYGPSGVSSGAAFDGRRRVTRQVRHD